MPNNEGFKRAQTRKTISTMQRRLDATISAREMSRLHTGIIEGA